MVAKSLVWPFILFLTMSICLKPVHSLPQAPHKINSQNLDKPGTEKRFTLEVIEREDMIAMDGTESYPGHIDKEELIRSYTNLTAQMSIASSPQLCEGRDLEYFVDDLVSFKREYMSVVEFASASNLIYLVIVGRSNKTLQILSVDTVDNEHSLILKKEIDLVSLLEREDIYTSVSQSDLKVHITSDQKTLIIKIRSLIYLFNIEDPVEPSLITRFPFMVYEDPGTLKTFFNDNCYYKLFISGIEINCFSEKIGSITQVHSISLSELEDCIKNQHNLRSNYFLRIKDIWVEDSKLYILDPINGLYVLNISKFKTNKEDANYYQDDFIRLNEQDKLFYLNITDGQMIKKAGNSLSIITALQIQGVTNYKFLEYIESTEENNTYSLTFNREEDLKYIPVKEIHRTADYIILYQENYMKIIRHSIPNEGNSSLDRLPISIFMAPGLVSLHQSQSLQKLNVLIAVYSDLIVFYEIKTGGLRVSCQTKSIDQIFTVVNRFKTKKENCANKNEYVTYNKSSIEYCKEILISYVALPKGPNPSYGYIGYFVLATVGWILFIVAIYYFYYKN